MATLSTKRTNYVHDKMDKLYMYIPKWLCYQLDLITTIDLGRCKLKWPTFYVIRLNSTRCCDWKLHNYAHIY
jgi:hypothetical protein